jgi:hypothetical protein
MNDIEFSYRELGKVLLKGEKYESTKTFQY